TLASLALVSLLAGCATTTPPAAKLTPQEELEPEVVPAPTLLIEYPPIELVEPATQPNPAAPARSPAPDTVAMAAPAPAAPQHPPTAEPSTDDQQLIALLGDLQRYGN